jgi:hypothetical protein
MRRRWLWRAAPVALCLLLCAAGAEARPRWASRGWLRSVDWKFAGAVLTQYAMANLDARTSLRCFQRFPSCHERNPLLGSHPSSARMYTQLNLYVTGLAVTELYLKDSHRRERGATLVWLTGPAVSLSYNLISSVGNIRLYSKYAAQCRASGKLVC